MTRVCNKEFVESFQKDAIWRQLQAQNRENAKLKEANRTLEERTKKDESAILMLTSKFAIIYSLITTAFACQRNEPKGILFLSCRVLGHNSHKISILV